MKNFLIGSYIFVGIPVIFWMASFVIILFMTHLVPVSKAISGIPTENPQIPSDWEITKLYLIIQAIWLLFIFSGSLICWIYDHYFTKTKK